MKKISTLVIAIFALASTTFGQTTKEEKGRIDVSATAEREVTPDIIYINVSLKEYFENNNTKKRVSITTLENQLIESAKKAGIDSKDITINNVNGYINYMNRKKNAEFLDSKNYKIKLKNLNKYNDLIDGIDPKGLVYSTVVAYEYSKSEEVKNELRIQAAKAAKEKAKLMLAAVDAKLGKIVNMNENIYDENVPLNPALQMMRVKTSINDVMHDEVPAQIDFKVTKIKIVVNATFEIEN